MALTMRLRVLDKRVIVHMLLASDQVQPVERGIYAFTHQMRVHVITREAASEREASRAKNAMTLFSNMEVGNVERRTILILNAIVI